MRLILGLFLTIISLEANIKVVVTYPYIGALTETIGGEKVDTEVLAQGSWDPHFVIPKPSLIGKIRNADLLIFNGADLEIGWLPPLLERASNHKINHPSNTLNLSKTVKLIDIPSDISRAKGDVHADGNPHFHLDPRNIPILADAITTFLIQKDPGNHDFYRKKLASFKMEWSANLKEWDRQMAPLKGEGVIQYHPVFNYFLRAYGLKNIGTIEPLAGIPPSSSHTFKLIQTIDSAKPRWIFNDVYHPVKTAEFLHDKTGIKLLIMPHDVGSMKEAKDLETLFDSLCGRLR